MNENTIITTTIHLQGKRNICHDGCVNGQFPSKKKPPTMMEKSISKQHKLEGRKQIFCSS